MHRRRFLHAALASVPAALAAGTSLAGCASAGTRARRPEATGGVRINLAHLDHLGEDVTGADGQTVRLVHIYADAPSYAWTGDPDEGIACVDDVARAALVYLAHAETLAPGAARTAVLDRAEALLRFILRMQRGDGHFYNFVLDRTLAINTTHETSRADRFSWWAARAVWALAEGLLGFAGERPALAEACAAAVARSLPAMERAASSFGTYTDAGGKRLPAWALDGTHYDATSELLLGLVAYRRARPSESVDRLIARFAQAFEEARFGSLAAFPYGSHASWTGGTHLWGNAQTQALAEASRPASARREADTYFARWLVEGPWHALEYETERTVAYEQIAYDIRTIAAGLAALARATSDARYGAMAGLAASWLTGNNAAATPMYDPETGRTFDGIDAPRPGATSPDPTVNRNSGAESTIEALLALQAVARVPEAVRWLHARAAAPQSGTWQNEAVRFRVFTTPTGERGALVLRPAADTSAWLTRPADLAALLG